MNLQDFYDERYKERNAKIRELLDQKGIEYTEMGDYNPICFVIDWGNKNKENEVVTNSDNVRIYFCAYNSAYSYRITKIYDTKGKNQEEILKIINGLNRTDTLGERYYLDEDGYVCMKYILHNGSESFAVTLLSEYKCYMLEFNFVKLIFKWKK